MKRRAPELEPGTLQICLLAGGFLVVMLLAGGIIYSSSFGPTPVNTATPPSATTLEEPQGDSEASASASTVVREPSAPIPAGDQHPQQAVAELQETPQQEEELVIVETPTAYYNVGRTFVLNLEQVQATESVRQGFENAMRVAGNPDSPEYLERWLEAQARADELLKAYLGPEDFSRLQSAAP